MPLRKMIAARIYPSFDVSFMTCCSFVNSLGNSFLVANIVAEIIRPITADVKTLTVMENFAAFGFPAPNSFETLTLQRHKNLSKGRFTTK